jgi:hypothetical protein
LQVYIRSGGRSTVRKPLGLHSTLHQFRIQGHLPKVGAGCTWYNELRVFSWRAQCVSADGGKPLRNLTVAVGIKYWSKARSGLDHTITRHTTLFVC